MLPGDRAGMSFPSQSEGMIIPDSPMGCFTGVRSKQRSEDPWAGDF